MESLSFFYTLLRETFPPKPVFSVEDIPDLSGKVMIVTGANTGIGKETAKALLSHNATVYITARSREKAERAIEELSLATTTPGGPDRDRDDDHGNGAAAVHWLQLDLADLASVKAAAEEFLRGVMAPPIAAVTAQGYDLQFGTNVLGHFYLTKLLLPALLQGAKSSPDGRSRVVTTSSSRSLFGRIDFATLKDGPARRRESPGKLYAQSKLGNVLFANALARRYGQEGVVSVSLNPGNLRSDLQRHLFWFGRAVRALVLYPVPYGALTQLWAGTSEEGAGLGGKYLSPWARLGTPNPLAEDVELQERLWDWCEEQVRGG